MSLRPFLAATRFSVVGILLISTGVNGQAASPDISHDGLAVWLEADTGVKADPDGKVSEWVDQSLEAPPPGTTHPTIKTETWNGKPVVHFEETPFVRIDQLITSSSDFSLFVVRSLNPRAEASALQPNDAKADEVELEERHKMAARPTPTPTTPRLPAPSRPS